LALRIREREDPDRAEVERFLDERYSARVARLGRIEDSLAHPALVAEEDGRVVGVLTYILGTDSCEVLTLHAAERLRGVGTALLRAVEELAAGSGCSSLSLITTNDNLDALRFYQRRGFRLAELHAGA
jgi:GNAT superfamily N-acetyltransferase